MVLPSIFNRSPSKKSKDAATPTLAHRTNSQTQGTPPSSPDKKSHVRVKERERTSSSRRSSTFSSKRSSKYDADTHPLNLSPEERQRLSFSSLSAMSAMDVDRDSSSPAPSSPAAEVPGGFPKTNGVNGDHEGRPAPPPHRYTKSPPPNSGNYAATPEAATPPAEMPTIDAEEYKAAGNKFFKIKDYPAAIKEYSKGMFPRAGV
jgi:DnaJ family protein C protein 7